MNKLTKILIGLLTCRLILFLGAILFNFPSDAISITVYVANFLFMILGIIGCIKYTQILLNGLKFFMSVDGLYRFIIIGMFSLALIMVPTKPDQPVDPDLPTQPQPLLPHPPATIVNPLAVGLKIGGSIVTLATDIGCVMLVMRIVAAHDAETPSGLVSEMELVDLDEDEDGALYTRVSLASADEVEEDEGLLPTSANRQNDPYEAFIEQVHDKKEK